MRTWRVVHVHSDIKFIDNNTRRLEDDRFENTVVIIGDRGAYRGRYADSALHFESSPAAMRALARLCSSADLVVLYDLTFDKCVLANRLPRTVSVAWRFFGYELYRRIPGVVFSDATRAHLHAGGTGIGPYLLKLKQVDRWHTTSGREFRRAMKRADSFWCLSDIEYEFLLRYWPALPQLVQLPFVGRARADRTGVDALVRSKRNEVIVGNSRSAYNNHLDVLDIVARAGREDVAWLLFFSYGDDSGYAKAVRERAAEIEGVSLIEDFLPLEAFSATYTRASALVMNSYRQMAMGNIVEALVKGVKIYLSSRNVIYDWLRREGVLVFPIEDLAEDVAADDIRLSADQMLHNIERHNDLMDRYDVGHFRDAVARLLSR